MCPRLYRADNRSVPDYADGVMTEQFADRLTAPGRLLVLSPTTIQQANQYFGTSGAIAVGFCYWQQCSAHHFRNCQAQPMPQPANPPLGAEIALFSQLWGTYTNTLHQHHTPYTRNSNFARLEPYYHNCGDLFMTREQLIHDLFITSL